MWIDKRHYLFRPNDQVLSLFKAALGGLLAGLAFDKGGGLIMPFALAFLWSSSRYFLAAGLWGGLAILVSHRWLWGLHPLAWIGIPDPLSIPVVFLIWLFCGGLGACLVCLWAFVGIRLTTSSRVSGCLGMIFHAVVMATIWGLAEVLLAKSPLFWIGIGNSLVQYDLALAGLARWFGGGGLAVIQLLIGWWIWRLAVQWRRRGSWKKIFVLGVIPLLIGHFLGWNLLLSNESTGSKEVALWQPAIPTRTKFSENQQRLLPEAFQKALRFSQKSNASWMIAPEGTLPIGQKLSSKAPLPLITGGFRWVSGQQRSSVLVFEQGDEFSSVAVDKYRLVPFGEWLPSWLGANFVGLSAVGGLHSGEPSRLLNWSGPQAAVAICYELSDGSSIARAVKLGAEWILAIANLDPYPITLQRQYLSLARVRSIETGRDLLSVANTGPTLKVSASGEVKQLLPPFKDGVAFTDLQLYRRGTGYTFWLELPLLFLLIAGLIGVFFTSKCTSDI